MSDFAVLFGRPHRMRADDRFELESLAVEELGVDSYAIPLDPVVNGEPERALKRLPRPRGRRWLYRGWMLNEEEYTGLYEAMSDRGEELVVDPESFAEAMYVPNYAPLLGDRTAPTRWTEGEDIAEAWELAQELGPPPWIIKDHMKSAKEQWHRACIVPEGADFDDFRERCERLIEARADRFERGIVIRKYLELATLPGWTPEQRRLTDEHRLVFWEGRLVAHAPYYEAESTLASPEQFAYLGDRVGSPFFTADVARLAAGGYTVIELNDGGCSTLPELLDPRDLYRALLGLGLAVDRLVDLAGVVARGPLDAAPVGLGPLEADLAARPLDRASALVLAAQVASLAAGLPFVCPVLHVASSPCRHAPTLAFFARPASLGRRRCCQR